MIAVPFINTMLNEEYRVFISQEFNHTKLIDLFSGWKYKDMVGWGKLTKIMDVREGWGIIIDFHPDYYKISNQIKHSNNNPQSFPYPQNLDQFICDCHRCLVNLYWQDSIVDSMNRIYFMDQSKIEEYNTELLTKIEKL